MSPTDEEEDRYKYMKLADIKTLSKSVETTNVEEIHLFGIFVREEPRKWFLRDEDDQLAIKLCGDMSKYPLVYPGDIVRIHRVKLDQITNEPYCLRGSWVVVWPAYRQDPTDISDARSPTIERGDNKRRKELETEHNTSFQPISEIKQENKFVNIAGRLEEKQQDAFKNFLLTIQDGTGKFNVRVFRKNDNKVNEISTHFDTAKDLEVGDFAAITNAKVVSKASCDLSANTAFGKSLRKVEKSSILGLSLETKLKDIPLPIQNNPEEPMVISQDEVRSSSQRLRRSPRLNPQPIVNGQDAPMVHVIKKVALATESPSRLEPGSEIPNDITKLCDIPKYEPNKYGFLNIAGQVRHKPKSIDPYGCWIFPLYDGSEPHSWCHHQWLENCATIIVYPLRDPGDSDVHFKKVQTLEEGDLVYVKNVKVENVNGRLRFGMSANETKGKSINMIDKYSKFGEKLLNDITPIDEDVSKQIYADPSDLENEPDINGNNSSP